MMNSTVRLLDLGRAWLDLREVVDILDGRECHMTAGRAFRASEVLRAEIQDRIRELAAR
jgi:hypothetical protein